MSILSSFWDQFLESLSKGKKNVPVLLSFLKQLNVIELTEQKIVLGCSNQGLKFYFDKRRTELEDLISSYAGKGLRVELIIIAPKKKAKETPLLSYQPSLGDLFYKTGLHSK